MDGFRLFVDTGADAKVAPIPDLRCPIERQDRPEAAARNAVG
jgi:hypothetical protein